MILARRPGFWVFLLFGAVLALGWSPAESWPQAKPAALPQEPPKALEVRREIPAAPEILNEIAGKNIFNPERKEFSVQAAEQMAKPIIRPQIVLYGVMISDQVQTASIVNPGRVLHKGEREMKTVKRGDSIGDYRVAKILEDRITMEAAGDSFEVLLFDPRFPKKRIEFKTPIKPAEITHVQPGTSPAAPTGSSMPAAGPAPSALPVARSLPAPPMPSPGPPALPLPQMQPAPMEATGAPRGMQTAPPGPASGPSTVPDPNVWRGRRPAPATPASP